MRHCRKWIANTWLMKVCQLISVHQTPQQRFKNKRHACIIQDQIGNDFWFLNKLSLLICLFKTSNQIWAYAFFGKNLDGNRRGDKENESVWKAITELLLSTPLLPANPSWNSPGIKILKILLQMLSKAVWQNSKVFFSEFPVVFKFDSTEPMAKCLWKPGWAGHCLDRASALSSGLKLHLVTQWKCKDCAPTPALSAR